MKVYHLTLKFYSLTKLGDFNISIIQQHELNMAGFVHKVCAFTWSVAGENKTLANKTRLFLLNV